MIFRDSKFALSYYLTSIREWIQFPMIFTLNIIFKIVQMISNLWSHSSEGKGQTLWSHRKDFVAWNNECVNITCR